MSQEKKIRNAVSGWNRRRPNHPVASSLKPGNERPLEIQTPEAITIM